MGNRSVYLDVIKGLAIILVVFAHCIQFGSGEQFYANQRCFSDSAFSFIYGFHMPLFMAVSGYLFRNSVSRHSVGQVVGSRMKSLLIPIIAWQTLYLLFLLLTNQISFSWSLSVFLSWSIVVLMERADMQCDCIGWTCLFKGFHSLQPLGLCSATICSRPVS